MMTKMGNVDDGKKEAGELCMCKLYVIKGNQKCCWVKT